LAATGVLFAFAGRDERARIGPVSPRSSFDVVNALNHVAGIRRRFSIELAIGP
jgi:hypothetical protein